MPDLQPILRGQLLILRPLRPQDFDALFAVASDPLIWEQHPASDRYLEPVFREFFRGALVSGGGFAVLDAADESIIGSSRYFGYDPDRREIEIGWTFLARRYWGGRYNGELKRLMLEHAFQFVDRVLFIVGPTNWRSRKAVEKIGGILAGMRVDPGSGRESVVYALTRPVFERHPAFQSGISAQAD